MNNPNLSPRATSMSWCSLPCPDVPRWSRREKPQPAPLTAPLSLICAVGKHTYRITTCRLSLNCLFAPKTRKLVNGLTRPLSSLNKGIHPGFKWGNHHLIDNHFLPEEQLRPALFLLVAQGAGWELSGTGVRRPWRRQWCDELSAAIGQLSRDSRTVNISMWEN